MKQPELGKKILGLRLSKGMTQSELAEKYKIGLRTIQRIEAAEVMPRSYTVRLIFSNLDYEFESSQKKNNFSEWTKIYKYVIDVFNLKKNTMKKVTVFSAILLICAGLFIFNKHTKAQTIEGWFKAGSKPNSYIVGLDKTIYKSGGSSSFVESIDKSIDGFGTLMQTCSAQNYLGKRIKMTSYVKSSNLSGWTGMWLRVDSKISSKALSFDNMQDRPITGTKDWTKCEIILDVPEESGTLNYGVLLSGTGKVWFDEISLEIVDKLKVQTTIKPQNVIPDQPVNIDFDK